MNKTMGLDFGLKRIGIAVSDALGISANPLKVLERKSIKDDIQALLSVIAENRIDRIVVGMPFNMDGSEGGMAEEVREFSDKLREASGKEPVFFDERLTTMQAERLLTEEADMSREKRKDVRDKVAAAILLQAYLDSSGGI